MEKELPKLFFTKRKLGFLDDKIPKLDDVATEIENGWSINSMLISWILQSIESTLRLTITYHETAKDLWKDLD